MNEFLAQNWGNVASAAGLAVSVWVLVVARKAKVAAEQARAAARLKSLVELLADANNRLQQVGTCLMGQRWDVAWFLSGEVAAACKLIIGRWGDTLTSSARGNLLEIASIAKSIVGVVHEGHMRPLSKAARRQALDAQLTASNLIGVTLGEARRIEERR